jgi:hypothetical protein
MQWTDAEREYVRANANTMTDEVIAHNLTLITGRPIDKRSARWQRRQMGIKKMRGRGICRVEEDLSR